MVIPHSAFTHSYSSASVLGARPNTMLIDQLPQRVSGLPPGNHELEVAGRRVGPIGPRVAVPVGGGQPGAEAAVRVQHQLRGQGGPADVVVVDPQRPGHEPDQALHRFAVLADERAGDDAGPEHGYTTGGSGVTGAGGGVSLLVGVTTSRVTM